MSLKPIGNGVALKRLEPKTTTSGGIILPDSAQEKSQEFEVVAVGPGLNDDAGNRISMEIKVGDIVIAAKWGGTDIKLDGEDIVIMKESDILAIVA